MSNQLAGSASPYLRQHADNPVHWMPWGEAAFEEAKRRDVPLFLSIGYSTCHWCHVMAHESFEDDQVAALLNAAFVCVKVDREEHPDVDRQYMRACVAMHGHGGWPLTILADHEGTPWFAATYIPKEAKRGHHGMMELVPALQRVWQEQREEIHQQSSHFVEHLARPNAPGEPREEWLQTAEDALVRAYDAQHGGFGGAPKFPSVQNVRFMLRRDPEMAIATLTAMAEGGIHDQVGGGFHRYATDAAWHLPHFEKMLYDQAAMLVAYAEAAAISGSPSLRRVANRLVDCVLRDLRSGDTFASAEDADSEGEEGTFYIWRHDEVADLGQPFMDAMGIKPEGNHLDEATREPQPTNILAGDGSAYDDELAILLERRSKRVRPGLDDKVLTDWNAMMAGALCQAGMWLDEPTWVGAGTRCLEALWSRFDGQFVHLDKHGYFADQAWMLLAHMHAYEATQDAKWLERAVVIAPALEPFEAEGGGFFAGGFALSKDIEDHDGAVVSATTAACEALFRLGRITGDEDCEAKAWRALEAHGGSIERQPTAHAGLLLVYDAMLHPEEVVLACDDGTMLRAAAVPRPGRVILSSDSESVRFAPWAADHQADVPTAFVCTNHACKAPTIHPGDLAVPSHY